MEFCILLGPVTIGCRYVGSCYEDARNGMERIGERIGATKIGDSYLCVMVKTPSQPEGGSSKRYSWQRFQ